MSDKRKTNTWSPVRVKSLRKRLIHDINLCLETNRGMVRPLRRSCSRQAKPSVRIMLMGESDEAAAWGIHLEDELTSLLAPEHELHFSWWKFNWLIHPKMLLLATDAAKEADIVVVLAASCKQLPWIVKRCLSEGLSSNATPPPRLLAFLDTADGVPSPEQGSPLEFLRDLGRAGNMEVYACIEDRKADGGEQ